MNEKERTGFAQVSNKVLFDPELSLKAKGLFAYMYAKPNGWNFSSERIAKETKEGRKSILSAMKELEESGYLRREKQSSGIYKDYFTYSKTQSPKKDKSQIDKKPRCRLGTVAKTAPLVIKKKLHSNTEKEEIKTLTNVREGQVPEVYGRDDINLVLEEFKTIMGFTSTGSKDRFMAKHLLRAYTMEQIRAMLQFCATNEYAPRIGSVEKLWYKRGDVIAGIKATKNKKKLKIVRI